LKLSGRILASLLLAGTALSTAGHAADVGSDTGWASLNGFYLRGGVGGIILDESADFNVGGAPFPNASLSIDPQVTAIVELGYFFSPNFAVSFTGGFPPTIDIIGTGNAAPLGRLGTTTYGPSTLTAHYHFDGFGAFQPYIGGGLSFLVVFDSKDGALTNFKVENSVGLALQAGADYMINENWGLFVDVKKGFLRTDSSGLIGGAVPATAKVKLDPWVISTGITYRF
jgi:outer membrane protein